MTDMRDYRNQWKKLEESWKQEDAEDTDVNVSATKKEKLEEGKRKVPDSFKAHQFKKKGAKEDKPEKDEKDESKEHEDAETKGEEKDEHKGKTIFGKKATEGSKMPKTGMTPGKTLYGVKKATEDAAPGSASGATTSAGAVAAPVNNTAPNIARVPERLGCKPGKKCLTKVQTRNESAGQRMFSHFRKFLEAEGFPVDVPAGSAATVAPVESPEAGMDDLGAEAPPEANLIADLQAKFPGAKISVTIEAGEVPFDAQTVEKAQEAEATTPEGEGDLEGMGDIGAGDVAPEIAPEVPEVTEGAMSDLDIMGQELAAYIQQNGLALSGQIASQYILKKNPAAIEHIDAIVQSAKEHMGGMGESIVMGEEGADKPEADVPEMEVGGEAGGAEELGGEGGELEAGAEGLESEITSDSITLSPEQWEAFLAGSTEEVGAEQPVDAEVADQEGSADQAEHKSENNFGV